jgi:hypothetical protein
VGLATVFRRSVRRIAEPRSGAVRRLPLGPARGIRFEADPYPSLDFWLGLFESELAPALRRYCTAGRTCVDVGSYNGYYALAFARLTGGPVRAYDAGGDALARMRRSLELNPSLAPLVELRQAWVGGETDPAGGRVTLDDDLAGWHSLGLLKVDVEGAEIDVLRGANRILAEQRPHVIVETHSPELERACGDLLIGHGYRPHVVLPRRLLRQSRPAEHNRWLVADGA